jgi:phosphopantothenoylcysteine decarboxylase/phosphopantothenate--cysteine ligase
MSIPEPGARPSVLLGVAGGIAAYKSAELLRLLTESGHAVRVLPTAAALQFVGAATFEALSGQPVHTGVFTDVPSVPHVRLGKHADLVVVAPATADLLARAAHGRADDLLTAALLTARCPVLFAPAMHTEMWEHPATRDNVALLRSRGAVVMEPASGPAHRRRHRPGPAARARRDPPTWPGCCSNARTPWPPTWPVAASSSPPAAPGNPWTRSATWATGRRGGRAGRWPGWPRSARALDTLVPHPPPTWVAPAGVDVLRVGARPGLREAMRSAADGRTRWLMAAGGATSDPTRRWPPQIDQERATPGHRRWPGHQNPDIPGRAGRPGAPPGQIAGRVSPPRPATRPADALHHGRPSSPQGLRPAVVNAVGDGPGFEVPDNAGGCCGRLAASERTPSGSKACWPRGWDAVAARLA